MPSPATRTELEQTLRQREAELDVLRAKLAAVEAALPPGISDHGAFLQQTQQVFDGMLHTDAKGRIIWANEAFLECYQCTLPQLLGRSIAHLSPHMPPDEAIEATVSAGIARGEAFQFEMPNPHPRNERNWLRLKLQPIKSATHTVELFVGLLQDISQKRRAQLALAESEERFQALAECAPCVLYRIRHPRGAVGPREVMYCSPQLQSMFGIEHLEDLRKFVHPDDRRYFLSNLDASVASHSAVSLEFRLLAPGQPMRWVQTNSLVSDYDEQGVVRSGTLEDVTPRRHAERDARQSTLRALMAMEGLGLGTWEYNYKNNQSSFSPEARLMMGYLDQMPDLKEEFLTDFLHPDDVADTYVVWNAYHQGEKEFFSCEHRIRCADGTYKWVLNRGITTKLDDQGESLIFTGVFADISERKKSEAAIATTALRLTTTIQKLKGGVLLVDENHKVVITNDAFCQLFSINHTPDELIGADYVAVQAMIQQCVAGPVGKAPFLHAPTVVQEGQEVHNLLCRLHNGRYAAGDFVPVRDNDSDTGFLWKFEDITDSYLAEATLRLREQKYRTIIDNMQLGLVELDLEKRVLYANPNYCNIIGYSNEELLGKPMPSLLQLPDEGQPVLSRQYQERTQGVSSSYELPIVTKDGTTKWLFSGAAPLYDQDHRLVGSIGISLDITHQKQLEQSLREAMLQTEHSARAKELFLANMSHEIRTPMNAILGMSQLLAKTPLAPRQSNYLHAITTSAQNLLVIINDILDLSKLEAGQMTIEQVGFNVNRLCDQVKRTLLYKAEEKGLSFNIKVNPLIPDVVLGDPYRITQILLNLAGNAIKFTNKGEVSIECEVVQFYQGNVEMVLVVRDTGIGIDPAYLKHIFQEFSQEDPSITRKFGGTGLGLSICRSLARLMGSEIVIESEKNQGTVIEFTLSLPVGTVEDLPHRRQATSGAMQELRGKHVLLVEDNEYNRMMARSFLVNSHIAVTEAENGQEAIACVESQMFDLILMDVQMPVMDGFEATHYLREELGLTIPIIALTASAISGEKERCLAAGMDDYLTKPFYEDELLQLLCDWMLRPTEVPVPPPVVRPVLASQSKGYNLDVLLDMARGDQKFVSSMLQTFIDSTHRALHELHSALAVGNITSMQAAAHKMRPSLRHLQIVPALELMDTVDGWAGPFSYDDLQPLVEATDQVLSQVLIDMGAELEKRRADGH